jgi:hypothetical protein
MCLTVRCTFFRNAALAFHPKQTLFNVLERSSGDGYPYAFVDMKSLR